ncbi:Uncharacterised protein [Escherichia coli]|uniref:Uncharacterized protein n=1 Tax=Escherichia coli TaxID=562 RepID=A0A376LL05_ECOLX|nr:Uncharacterised protein [Escherichia coli]
MKMFKGLNQRTGNSFHHIAVLLEAGLIISASGDEECDELSDDIFYWHNNTPEAHAMHLRSKEHDNSIKYS